MSRPHGPTVLLVGLGDLGGVLLESLIREPSLGRILVASRDEVHGQSRINLARASGLAQGRAPGVEFVQLDLRNVEQTADLVAREQPEIVLSTATMQTWWLGALLPPDLRAGLARAKFGAWLPVHLVLGRKLMEGLRAADYQGFSLTAPYPDAVNVVLSRLGLAPTCGIGNVDEQVAKIRDVAAERLNASPHELSIRMVGHHALHSTVFARGQAHPPQAHAPYHLEIKYRGQEPFDSAALESIVTAPYPIPPGPVSHFMTAACAATTVRALLDDVPSLVHVPAPEGLPGGYPVWASSEGVERAPLVAISPEQAVEINERAQVYDGIASIEADGTVVLTEASAAALEEVLGLSLARIGAADFEACASEMLSRFRALGEKYGVSQALTRSVRSQ